MTDNPAAILAQDLATFKNLLARAQSAILQSNRPSFSESSSGWYRTGYWAFGGILVQWAYGKVPPQESNIYFLRSFNNLNYALVAGSNYDPGHAVSFARAAKKSSNAVEVLHAYGNYNDVDSHLLSVIAVGIDPNFSNFD